MNIHFGAIPKKIIFYFRNVYPDDRFGEGAQSRTGLDFVSLSIHTLFVCPFVSNKHQNGWTDNCDKCEFAATAASSLKRHIEHIYEGVTYPCFKCIFVAARVYDLKKHNQSKHEGVGYPCDKCEYAATRAGDLKTHKERKHYL